MHVSKPSEVSFYTVNLHLDILHFKKKSAICNTQIEKREYINFAWAKEITYLFPIFPFVSFNSFAKYVILQLSSICAHQTTPVDRQNMV